MRFPHSLHWRIAIAYTTLIFFTMGGVSLYLVDFVRDALISDVETRLEQQAHLLSRNSVQYFQESADLSALQASVEGRAEIIDARVTVIDIKGNVLADNFEDPAKMGNLSSTPEFAQSLTNGIGRSTRLSSFLQQNALYIAVPIEMDGENVGVARVSVPTFEVQSNVNQIILTIALSALVVAVLSVALGYYLARRTSRSVYSVAEGARRLALGDLNTRVRALVSDETKDLADAFNSMSARIRETVSDLSEERNKLSVVLETMADGVVVIDSDGKVSLMNSAAEWFLGTSVEETHGGRFSEIVRDHELQQLVIHTMESGGAQHSEVELLHRRRIMSAIATPLTHGGPDSVVLTLHDLTRIRQVENTRKEFVANVSHELRSPLTGIKAMVETLEAGAIDNPEDARNFLVRIRRDVDRMNNIVNDLLELSLLESGQTALHLGPLDMIPLIENLILECGSIGESQEITITSSLPENLPLVIGEEQKIHQVMVNLVENALKFTPKRGEITISARENYKYVEVLVTDTGDGIAPEHLPHVFERFYKVDRSRHDGGTGLGLAIVKHVVQAHGGDVRVESAQGVGSAFSFTIPRAT